MRFSLFALALAICLDLHHPMRKLWPHLNDLPDVDAIARELAAVPFLARRAGA